MDGVVSMQRDGFENKFDKLKNRKHKERTFCDEVNGAWHGETLENSEKRNTVESPKCSSLDAEIRKDSRK